MSCVKPVVIRAPATMRSRPECKDGKMVVPCGRCVGCALDYGRNWSVRCYHESLLHSSNYFLTLTVDDAHLHRSHPDLPPSLDPQQVNFFIKSLRNRGKKFRYFLCGEYGSKTSRPHYHMIVFGLTLTDLRPISKGLVESPWLNEIWGLGTIAIGNVTPESIAYCCRYTVKKVMGRPAQYYYDRGIYPEFVRMSRRPGIGADFFKKYRGDIYNSDKCWLPNGFLAKVPRYYDKLLEASAPEFFTDIKDARLSSARKSGFDMMYPDVFRNISKEIILRSKLLLKDDVL